MAVVRTKPRLQHLLWPRPEQNPGYKHLEHPYSRGQNKIKINLNFYHSVLAHFLEFDCDGDDDVDDKDNGLVPGSLIPLKALIFEFVWILGLV